MEFRDMQPAQALEWIAEWFEEMYDDDGDFMYEQHDQLDVLEEMLIGRGLLTRCDECSGVYMTANHDECPYQGGANEHAEDD